ncbi:MAG: RIP metalloprotease RseP [bacterium]|nr:RIP metalloprotease RseP [bacterium]
MILPILIFFAIAIIFHELGHFLACKLFGIRVEVFSIGFPPKLVSKKIGNTEYAISLIPLGGYVKIAGQDPTQEITGAPDEFVSHPLWHRALVVVAGPVFNILVALILMYMLFIIGTEVNTFSNTIGIVTPNSLADRAGLKPGDKIIAIDGQKVKYWDDIYTLYGKTSEVVPAETGTKSEVRLTVDRAGDKLEFILPRLSIKTAQLDLETDYGLRPYVPEPYVEVELVAPNSIAYRAGLRQGDKILAISNLAGATTFHSIIDGIHHSPDTLLILTVQRNNNIFPIPVRPELATPDAKYATIGFIIKPPVTYKIKHSPVESIQLTFISALRIVSLTASTVADVFTGKMPLRKAFGGPQSIAIVAQQQANLGITQYLFLVALLSFQLGIINLFPFPVLDGGHLLLYTIEKIRKKPFSVKTLENISRFGVAVLVSLMLYFIINDLIMSGTLTKFF